MSSTTSSSPSSSSLLDWFTSPQQSPDNNILLLDGGVSTWLEQELSKKNQQFSHRALWSSSLLLNDQGQQDIYDCHMEFLRSGGCNIVSTVTYQCHYGWKTGDQDLPSTSKTRLSNAVVESDERMTKMLQDGARIAQKAVHDYSLINTGRPYYVAASIGCFGGALADGSEYTGDYKKRGVSSIEPLVEFHQRKLQVLLECQPDAVAFETIPCVLECRAILALLRSIDRREVATWVSFACQDGDRLNDGSKIEDALDVLVEHDPDVSLVQAVGINCCDSEHVPSLLTRIVRHMATNSRPRAIVVYPNSGEQWDAANECWMEGTGCTTPKEFARRMMQASDIIESTWKEATSNTAGESRPCPKVIVGGCCRTSPETIAAIRKELDERFKET